MPETRVQYIPDVTVRSGITTYPRYIGEVLPHPFIQNTLLEVLEVWDGSDEVWGNLNEPIPFSYGSEYNPIARDWNTPPPRRDESSKYPIYKCRVNGTNEQWIIFKWILLDENKPDDLLGYSNTQVASGNALPTPPIAPNLPITTTFRTLPIETAMDFSDATFTTEASTDSDALAVIAAIEATGVTLSTPQKTAITNRVVSAKADGVWTKWRAYYGFVGGTAAAHAINWKNPSQFLMTWNGTITHDAFGVKGNGSTGYGDTGLSPFTSLTLTGCGLGYYLTENKASAPTWDCGAAGGTPLNNLDLSIYNGTAFADIGNVVLPPNSISSANNGLKQYLSCNAAGSTGKLYRDGASVASTTVNGAMPNSNVFICAYSVNNAPQLHSVARFGSLSVNTGLTDAEEATNYVSELAFQTALGRN